MDWNGMILNGISELDYSISPLYSSQAVNYNYDRLHNIICIYKLINICTITAINY